MNVLRRLGPDRIASSCTAKNCPDLFELDTGEFAVIGAEATAALSGKLPAGSSCGPGERIVVIPRALLLGAKPYIPGGEG